MQPFIFVYHIVAYIFSLPKTILSYSFKGLSATLSLFNVKTEKKGDSKEIEDEVKKLMAEKQEETIKEEPLFSYRYIPKAHPSACS